MPLSVFPNPVAFNISPASTTLLKPGNTREQEQGGELSVMSSLWMLLLYMCIYIYYIYASIIYNRIYIIYKYTIYLSLMHAASAREDVLAASFPI